MRASDQLKAVRSFVVISTHHNGLHVKASHWAPGYTPAYCSTPLEAIDYAIEQAEIKMTEAQAKVVELHDLRATEVAEAEEKVGTFLSDGHRGPSGERLI